MGTDEEKDALGRVGQTWLLPRSFSLAPSHSPHPQKPSGGCTGWAWTEGVLGVALEVWVWWGVTLHSSGPPTPTLAAPNLCHVPDHCWLSLPPRAWCLGSVGHLVLLLRPL